MLESGMDGMDASGKSTAVRDHSVGVSTVDRTLAAENRKFIVGSHAD